MKANLMIMSAIVVVLFLLAWYFKGISRAGEGLKDGLLMVRGIWPLLVLALAAVGLLQLLAPTEAVGRYLGTGRPYLGIVIACMVGAVMPGAPYVTLPLAALLLSRGASIGAATAFVLSASLIGFTRIPFEIAFVGWQFSVLRLLACALLAPAAGIIIHWLNLLVGFYPTG